MDSSDLMTTLRDTVAHWEMLPPGQTVVIGVSGGPDSTALLHALAALRAEFRIGLVAAHLNHGFRGAEADADADAVAALAARLNVACRIERADVPAMRRRLHLSAQEAARNARHAFLRRVAAEAGAERIALAHTRDDRVETVLLNLLRGTGMEGLSGFAPISLPILRPLFDASRAQVEAYCAAHALAPRQDSSNASLDYRRNRIRTELLPYLTAYYNEKARDAILRMADLAAADNRVLEEAAAEAFARAASLVTDSEVVLEADALGRLPLALQRRVLRRAIARVRGHLQNIGREILERVLEAGAQSEVGKPLQIALPAAETGTVRLLCTKTAVRIVREAARAEPLPWQQELAVPGETSLLRAGFSVEARLCGTRAEAAALAADVSPLQPMGAARAYPGPSYACFARADVTLPILARSWQPGDRMRPRGLGGSKKLQDLFTDRKVPAAQRVQMPVCVEAGGQGRILWVVGLALDERALRLEGTPPAGEEEDGDILLLRADILSTQVDSGRNAP
jgi:tRNA(Ile)-lysidine synthase